MQKQTVLTKEGYEKLEKELEELKGVKRKEVAEKIKVALGYGDLSENSEYDEAKNEQAILEARIADVEVTLKNARVLTESEMNDEQIHVGSTVRAHVSDAGSSDGREIKLMVVGSSEADPISGRISDESAVGAGLLGHVEGDKVEIEVPAGRKVYQILQVIK
ncbi:MAG: transcription elongation factor GreA [Oscillospiraceae bacterium]|jgi:transcription elongation factor GreA|nr:transcription elongation factor GreA [Oscillospiraceae bacterium]MDD3260297.1 transcription elongation factor GreA [Oscillospiraceae bacterium]